MIPKDSPKIFRRKLLFFAFLFINLLLHFISILHYSKEHLGVTHKLDEETGVWRAEARKQGASKLMTPQHPVQTSLGFSLELPGGQSRQESRVVARVQEQGG